MKVVFEEEIWDLVVRNVGRGERKGWESMDLYLDSVDD